MHDANSTHKKLEWLHDYHTRDSVLPAIKGNFITEAVNPFRSYRNYNLNAPTSRAFTDEVETLDKNPTHFFFVCDKDKPLTRHGRDFSQHDKGD